MPCRQASSTRRPCSARHSRRSITTNAADLWGLLAGGSDKVAIHEIRLGLVSTGTVSGQIGVTLLRGSTASSTSGSAIVNNLKGQSGTIIDPSSVTLPCTGLVSTNSATLLYADSFQTNWAFRPSGIDAVPWVVIDPGQRLHVRLSAPSTAISLSGSLTYEILGRGGLF